MRCRLALLVASRLSESGRSPFIGSPAVQRRQGWQQRKIAGLNHFNCRKQRQRHFVPVKPDARSAFGRCRQFREPGFRNAPSPNPPLHKSSDQRRCLQKVPFRAAFFSRLGCSAYRLASHSVRPHSPKSLRTILNLDACQFFLKHAEMLAWHRPALWEEQCLTSKRARTGAAARAQQCRQQPVG